MCVRVSLVLAGLVGALLLGVSCVSVSDAATVTSRATKTKIVPVKKRVVVAKPAVKPIPPKKSNVVDENYVPCDVVPLEP